MDVLVDAYEQWKDENYDVVFSEDVRDSDLQGAFRHSRDIAQGLDYGEEELRQLCESLNSSLESIDEENRPGPEMDDYAGLFVTGLANELGHVELPEAENINFLGAYNEEDIVVDGDAGDWFGYKAQPDSTLVAENVGRNFLREAEGGTAAVLSAGQFPCDKLNGATAHIYGEAESGLGGGMIDGEIHSLEDNLNVGNWQEGGEIWIADEIDSEGSYNHSGGKLFEKKDGSWDEKRSPSMMKKIMRDLYFTVANEP